MKGHDVYTYKYMASLKLTTWPSLASSLCLPSCLRLSECWHCRYEPCYLTHFFLLFFLEASVCSHCTPVTKPTITKDSGALHYQQGVSLFFFCLNINHLFIIHVWLAISPTGQETIKGHLWYTGMLSVRSIYLWDRKLAWLPQCPTVFFDLHTLEAYGR